jgi:hypothetical protein
MQAAQPGAVAAVCRETGGLQAVDDAIAALQCPAADPHNRCNIPTAVKGHDPIRFRHQPHGQGFVKSVAGDVQSAIAMLFYRFVETLAACLLSDDTPMGTRPEVTPSAPSEKNRIPKTIDNTDHKSETALQGGIRSDTDVIHHPNFFVRISWTFVPIILSIRNCVVSRSTCSRDFAV